MKMRWQISAMLLGAALAFGPASAWTQQPYPGQEDHRPKQDMRNAGHEAKDAARDTGRAIKHGAQKATNSTRRHARHAAHRTRNAVRGAREGAQQPQ